MRYWVYQDARIQGPLDPKELEGGRLRADALVCEEGAGGEKDQDWRRAEEVAELSGLYVTRQPTVSLVDLLGEEDSLLEQLRFEPLGLAAAPQEDWLSGVFSAKPLKAGTQDVAAELAAAQQRVQELTQKLESLTRRLEEAAAPAASQPSATVPPPPIAPHPEPEKPPLVPEAESNAPSPPAVVKTEETDAGRPILKPSSPAPRQKISFGAPKNFPAVKKRAPDVTAESEPQPSEPPKPAASVSSEPALPASEQPASGGHLLKLPSQVASKEVKLGAPKKFAPAPKAAQAPAPAQSPSQPASQEPVAPPPVATPTPTPAPLAPESAAIPAPTPPPPPAAAVTELPPMPVLQPQPSAASPSLEPPPMPALAKTPLPSVTPPPATMAYSGFFSAPAPAASASEPIGTAEKPAATEEVLARLAKPQATEAPSPEKPRRGDKKFLVISGILIVALVAVVFMFFQDSKSIPSAVDMGGGQALLGTAVEGQGPQEPPAVVPAASGGTQIPGESETAKPPVQEPLPSSPTPILEAAPSPAAPVVASPVAIPEASAPAAVKDDRQAAIELVKTFPIDGDRGTIGRWLEYSFTASPGFQEKWDAGAVEGAAYLVQYTVQDAGTGKNLSPAVTYLFEADLERRIVQGKNQAARQLLAGGQAPVQKTQRKSSRKSRPRRVVPKPASAPQQLPQLPLPLETELLPPGEEGASRSDAVESGF